jgi:serine phosphatase RsbU (regulator of sigma subunit)
VPSGSGPQVAVPADPPTAVRGARAELADEIALSLTGSLNLRRTALRLLDLIKPELADWAMLVLPDSRTGGLALYGGDDAGFTTLVARAAADDSGLARVLRTGQAERLHVALDPPSADGLAVMIPHPGLCAQAAARRPADALAVGLTARGSTVGALVTIRGHSGYGDDEMALAQRVGARAAVALDSARLYEERGLLASALQQALRPPALPDIDGVRLAARYRPAAEHLDIGGDFYDVHGSADDLLVALGDVCGKGVEAAALTGRTRQSIRTAAYFDRRPAELLTAVNSVLYEAESDRFVTVLCARVRPDRAAGQVEVELATAGHPPPLVLRANGAVEEVDVAGTAAGLLPHVRYRAIPVSLRRGDTMLMFTDGIIEARGAAGLYGVERLAALLPAYAGAAPDVVCEAVEQDVVEYLDGETHDDIALLALSCVK